ncbi:cell division cycle-associated protein 2 [Callospermophilus lateralis]|uniref:cell division cycle-associated protein 2 n=1 Tax=Callospermophilus lateralis TaxID=76772 RepID=UPI0040387E70
MDTNSKDKEPSEIKESAINNAENAAFILGTGKLVIPQKHAAGMTPDLCTPDTFKSSLNFSTATIEQLGITPESSVKNSSGKKKNFITKKSRRRSSIGTRGSPETNHLIRFIAQRRILKNAKRTSLAQDSPFQGSPGLYQNVSSLRERISAFQTAFHSIKKDEKMIDCPEFSGVRGGFETTGLTNMEGLGECQQSGFSEKLPCKRRRISLQSSSDDNLSNVERGVMDLQILSMDVDGMCADEASADLPEKSSELGLTQPGYIAKTSSTCLVGPEASNECKVPDYVEGTESSDAVLIDILTAGASSDTVPEAKSSATTVCKRDIPSTDSFVLRSVLKKPSGNLFAENLQEHHDNHCDDLIDPGLISNLSNCCEEQKAEDQESLKTPAFLNVRKRKRVTFGEDLSPEVFDESLPANTPLRKGGTPVRQKDLSSVSPLLLEQSPVPEQLPQPNFEDKGENLENIEPLQVSFGVLNPSVSENLSGTDTFSSSNNHEKVSSRKIGRLTRTSGRRSQLISFAEENVCNLHNAETKSCKEKKINRRKSQETKYRNRALPKKNQVSQSCTEKKGKWMKRVQKSLYGEREMASKKPLLSPIPELPEVCEMIPLVPGVRRMCSDGCNSNGKLEEETPPKIRVKKNILWPQNPKDLHVQQGLGESDVYGLCRSYIKTSMLPGSVTSEEDPNTNTVDTKDNGNIPKAENTLESENQSKTETKTETKNSQASCASVMGEHIVSDHPKPDFILQCQESAAAGQNAEKLCQTLKISEDIRYEKQEDLVVAAEGKLQGSPFMCESHKEFNCLEDVLIGNIKEAKCNSDNVGRKSPENSIMSCREKKHRRRSMCYSDGQNLHLEQNGNHEPFYSVGSSLEINLEQIFQRENGKTKVRRSSRFQKNSESEGLMWISPPCPPTSQKSRRRTISTFDCRSLGNMSPIKEALSSRQNPHVVVAASGEESSQDLAAECWCLPEQRRRRRRRSFCAPTLSCKAQYHSAQPLQEKSLSKEGRKPLAHPPRGGDRQSKTGCGPSPAASAVDEVAVPAQEHLLFQFHPLFSFSASKVSDQ